MFTGKAFAWCIIILTLGGSYEVFVRYLLNSPTGWAYDMSYIMYGALFLMAGPYALSRDGHVRGDVVYRLFPQRVQAGIDMLLHIVFLLPGVAAMMYQGAFYAQESWTYMETSIFSPMGIPIYPLKTLIPFAGLLLFLQGTAEVTRCVWCMKHGYWPQRLRDVEETETAIMHQQEAEHGDKLGTGGQA
ncbi:TRAP transporter small permease subunit [Rhodovibrio salinarum]|nr:TRAP transporter small permease subunit [Rhodovibrio salinarum]